MSAPVRVEPPAAAAPPGSWSWRRDGFALGALAGLAAWMLWISWRKWPDALIDFGRELYGPWQLAEGAVLYRDVDSFYGPLSLHLNGMLFRIFGPGMMVLVVANLAVFAALVTGFYFLFRRAWGRLAALAAGSLFVAVFGFSQLLLGGNYNYATPYSHETTHGLAVLVALVFALTRWIEAPGWRPAAAAGLLAGLTAVLKPEILFAAGLMTAAAAVARWRTRSRPTGGDVLIWLGAFALPTAVFVVHFWRHVPLVDALSYASRAWLNVTAPGSAEFSANPLQRSLMGLDDVSGNLLRSIGATALGAGVLGAIAAWAWASGRIPGRTGRSVAIAVGAGLVAFGSWRWIPWFESGAALPGLAFLALLREGWLLGRPGRSRTEAADFSRLLLVVLGTALLARMVLNGRIYQFGYYQAAPAAMVVVALAFAELPRIFTGQAWGARTVAILAGVFFGCGAANLVVHSARILALKTEAVGEGRDRFYAFPPERWPPDSIVRWTSAVMKTRPDAETLLVLPEGQMVNYLARKRSPVAPFFFFSAATEGGREEAIVETLKQRPPEWIIVIGRPLREYGIQQYGDRAGNGRLILTWANENYVRVDNVGGDPLASQFGAVILRRK